jgi:hypothetical protein
MKAQKVFENISFERGKDIPSSMQIGMIDKIKKDMEDSGWEYRDPSRALTWAVYYADDDPKKQIEYIRYLLSLNTKFEDDLLGIIIKRERYDLIKIFLENGANPNSDKAIDAIKTIISRNTDLRILKLLIKNGLDINSNSKKLAQGAMYSNSSKYIKFLVDNGLDIDKIPDRSYATYDLRKSGPKWFYKEFPSKSFE